MSISSKGRRVIAVTGAAAALLLSGLAAAPALASSSAPGLPPAPTAITPAGIAAAAHAQGTTVKAAPAYAAKCWAAGFQEDGYNAYYCNNVVGAPIYAAGSVNKVIDHLRTNPSWFACKTDSGPANGEGSPHPNRWEWTQGDDNGKWGWVSDADIYNETNPMNTCVL